MTSDPSMTATHVPPPTPIFHPHSFPNRPYVLDKTHSSHGFNQGGKQLATTINSTTNNNNMFFVKTPPLRACFRLCCHFFIRRKVALDCGGGKARAVSSPVVNVMLLLVLAMTVAVILAFLLQCGLKVPDILSRVTHADRMPEGALVSMVERKQRSSESPLSLVRSSAGLFQSAAPLHVTSRGENIKVGETTEVHVMSAVQREDYPVPGAFNVVLIAWVDQKRDKNTFVCCFTNSSSSPYKKFVQVPARSLIIDKRCPTVLMRLALFGCTLDVEQRRSSANKTDTYGILVDSFNYVAFSEETCQKDVTFTAHEIVKSAREGHLRSKSGSKTESNFAVCLKVAYGELSPQSLVEWFELARIVGVTIVHVYYHIINEGALKVFKYYESTGFAVLSPVTPAVMKGHPPRGFQRPRWEEQAWMDGTVTCNDCLQRCQHFRYVAILDLDELLVPLPPYRTVEEVMEAAVKKFPMAGGFFIDSYIVVLDWPAADNVTSVSFLRYLDRTLSNRVDNSGIGKSSPKLIVLPSRVSVVFTHNYLARGNYTSTHVPTGSLTFLHYRRCKVAKWNHCTFPRTRDRSLQRFKPRWVHAISRLPLVMLGCGKQYARAVTMEAKHASGAG